MMIKLPPRTEKVWRFLCYLKNCFNSKIYTIFPLTLLNFTFFDSLRWICLQSQEWTWWRHCQMQTGVQRIACYSIGEPSSQRHEEIWILDANGSFYEEICSRNHADWRWCLWHWKEAATKVNLYIDLLQYMPYFRPTYMNLIFNQFHNCKNVQIFKVM